MTSVMRAVEEALTTKKPLPQFLPSARIAHLRVINRVRTLLIGDEKPPEADDTLDSDEEEYLTYHHEESKTSKPSQRHKMLLRRYMSWSATSSALEEVIEYLEELVDLTKLLVGYNEFRYGFLSRPLYDNWAEASTKQFDEKISKLKSQNTTEESSSLVEAATSDNVTGFSTGTRQASYNLDEPGQPKSYEPQYLVQLGDSMAPLERRATLEFPKKFRKRKNSLIVVQPSMAIDGGIAQPYITSLDTSGASPAMLQTFSETNELPVSLKRVISRRHDKK